MFIESNQFKGKHIKKFTWNLRRMSAQRESAVSSKDIAIFLMESVSDASIVYSLFVITIY